MALQIKLEISGYVHQDKTVTLNDVTGNYNVTTNPGGFGNPNPERNVLGLAIIEEIIEINRFKQGRIIVENPNTVTTWTAEIEMDGVYAFNMIAAPWFTDVGSVTGVAVGDYLFVADVLGTWDGVDIVPLGVNDKVDLSKFADGFISYQDIFIRKFADEYLMNSVLNSRPMGCMCPEQDYRIEACLNSASIAYLNRDLIKAQEDMSAVELFKEEAIEQFQLI